MLIIRDGKLAFGFSSDRRTLFIEFLILVNNIYDFMNI